MSISTIPPDPVSIVVSGEQPPPIIISTSDNCRVLSVNGKLGFVIVDKSDVGLSYVENISILGTSGYLQGQIDGLDLNYASQSEFNSLSGQLLSSGILLKDIINSLSGSLNNTGSYLLYQINDIKNWTGSSLSLYYPLNSNPSGYLTNDDITGFITGFNSGDYLLKSETGQFYASNNPLGFITSAALSPYMTGFNSGDYVLKTDTGNFATSSSLEATGSNLQSQINNLDSIYATDSQLASTGLALYSLGAAVSGNLVATGSRLDNKINSLSGSLNVTGINLYRLLTGVSGELHNYYPNSNPSGYITGIDSSLYVTGSVIRPSDTGNFYTKDNPSGFITGVDLSSYVTGSVVRPNDTGIFITQNQTGGLYPSYNPSGYLTNSDITNFASIGLAAGLAIALG
jgi:hypothetical protein